MSETSQQRRRVTFFELTVEELMSLDGTIVSRLKLLQQHSLQNQQKIQQLTQLRKAIETRTDELLEKFLQESNQKQ